MKKLKARKLGKNGEIIQKERFSKCQVERYKTPNGKRIISLFINSFPVPERIILGADRGSNQNLKKVSPLSEEEKDWIRKKVKESMRFW